MEILNLEVWYSEHAQALGCYIMSWHALRETKGFQKDIILSLVSAVSISSCTLLAATVDICRHL
jgi:hypothetical protein